MGGQACVLYGAAEFSRDADLAVLAEAENLDRLRAALQELDAEVIAVAPFVPAYLERGHAIHFRYQRQDVAGLRVDVMARMRGVDAFPVLRPESDVLLRGARGMVQALVDSKPARDSSSPRASVASGAAMTIRE